jgi:GntR family transcriptional regulator
MADPVHELIRDTASPIFEQLARIVADKIHAGQLTAGERLPTELEFAREYRISRDTVRQAIGILERQGLVIRRRAKGTFVATPRVIHNLSEVRSFHGSLLRHGVVPEMELLDFRPATAPAPLAAYFPRRDVMRLVRRYIVDGKPLAVTEIYLHPMTRSISWDVAERYDSYTIFERFLRVPVASASATIRAEAIGRSMGRLLDLRPSTPVLVLVQKQHALSGEVLACSLLRVRADAYEFRVDLPEGLALYDVLGSAMMEAVC